MAVGEVVNSDGAAIETDDETGRFVKQTGLTTKQARLAEGMARGLTVIEAGRLCRSKFHGI